MTGASFFLKVCFILFFYYFLSFFYKQNCCTYFLTYVSIYKSGTVSTTSTCSFPRCLRSTGKTKLNESIVEAIVNTRRVSISFFLNKCDHTGIHIRLLHRDRAGSLGRHVRGSRDLQPSSHHKNTIFITRTWF